MPSAWSPRQPMYAPSTSLQVVAAAYESRQRWAHPLSSQPNSITASHRAEQSAATPPWPPPMPPPPAPTRFGVAVLSSSEHEAAERAASAESKTRASIPIEAQLIA